MLLYPAIELRQHATNPDTANEAAAQARHFAQLGFRHLYLIDRDAQHGGTPFNLPLVKGLLQQAGIPTWVGGGIRDMATIDALITAGASHVVVGPSLWHTPGALEQAAKKYPGQIIALIDAYAGHVVHDAVAARNTPDQSMRVLDQALLFERAGIAGIIYMEHEREGQAGGLDTEVIADLAFALTVPLYVTGGIHAMSDLRALKAEAHTGITGVILGRALYDGDIDPAAAIKAALA